MTRSRITAEMRAAVGSVVEVRVSWPVSASDIRKWALAVYFPEPPPQRFLESWSDVIAPEEFNPFAWSVAQASDPAIPVEYRDIQRVEKSIGVEGPPLHHQINAGSATDYSAPIRAGDIITSTTRLSGYEERTGRLGLMLLTSLETTWTNQDGQEVKRSVDTSIRY